MDKQLLLFGLMLKAGRIVVGDEPVTDAIRRGEIDVLCVAGDAAANTADRFARYAEEEELPLVRLPYDKSEFGGVLGRREVAVAGITDVGFAARLLELAAESDASLADAAARYRRKADAIVEEQKKKRRASKKPAWQKAAAPAAAETAPQEKKSAETARSAPKKNGAPRYSENREAPGKVYGRAPRSQKVSLGERRREDAARKLERQENGAAESRTGGRPAYDGKNRAYGGGRSGGRPVYGEKKPAYGRSGAKKTFDPRENRNKKENAPRSGGRTPSYAGGAAEKRPAAPSVKRGKGGKA
ncbi:MAG: L7Ae/L30e/S12e/Gadd45 family ribosomal protein [Eubacteriales bacterium]